MRDETCDRRSAGNRRESNGLDCFPAGRDSGVASQHLAHMQEWNLRQSTPSSNSVDANADMQDPTQLHSRQLAGTFDRRRNQQSEESADIRESGNLGLRQAETAQHQGFDALSQPPAHDMRNVA
mmetsp:Transcript_20132/g.51253  ORF Transcript_20132/g.51253 Transcript_20132/m.51253 type:complete len:124 (-) Transcript_20132:295-666(-)